MIVRCAKCEKPYEYHIEDNVIFRECDCESVTPPMNKIPIVQFYKLLGRLGNVIPYKEPPQYPGSYTQGEIMKPCWYKRDSEAKWECGFFHQWSQSHEEFETGPRPFPAAIVEDAAHTCHVVYAGHVSFSNDDPDPDPPIKGSVYEWLKKMGSTPHPNPKEKDAKVVDMSQRDRKYNLPDLDKLIGKKPKRFKPRLVWVAHFNQWLVQVHPEAIEVFNDNADFVCQIRWIRGEMNYTYQGSLPIIQLKDMFKETP